MVEALLPIARGQEISFSYGNKPNYIFFINYGFINESNEEYDVVEVTLTVDPKVVGAQAKRHVLGLKDGAGIASTFQVSTCLNQ